MSEEKKKAGKIYEALAKIGAEIHAIAKKKTANGNGFTYQYRGIDDVYNALNPLLGKHKVFCTPRESSHINEPYTDEKKRVWNHVTVKMCYDFFAADGSMVTVGPIGGEGADLGDKATSKALSMAHKYALIEMFHIPVLDMSDGDASLAAAAIEVERLAVEKAQREKLERDKKNPGSTPATPVKASLTPAEIAKKMTAVAPAPFHPMVAPAVAKTEPGDLVAICYCGDPEADHPSKTCVVVGCDCPGFEALTYVPQHLAMDFKNTEEFKKLVANESKPLGQDPETLAMANLDICQDLKTLGKVFNEFPQSVKTNKVTQHYGKLFIKFKKTPAPVGAGKK